MLAEALSGLEQVLQLETLLLMLLGVAIGLTVGILPGLGGAVTLALMLPFVIEMSPVQALALLVGMWVVTSTAGDITSALLGVPGDATAVSTVLDGYPMTKRGESRRALGIVLSSSALGSVIGISALILIIPIIRPLVLAFGPPEFFAMVVVGLTFVVALSGKNLLKGFIMTAFGLIVAFVGIDPQEGIERYTFDQLFLWDGFGIVPIVVGLFGGAEVFRIMMSKRSIASESGPGSPDVSRAGQGIRDTLRHWRVVIQSSVIGIGIGIVPGLGGSVAQWVAYGSAQQSSKTPEKFGKGAVEGVVASGAVSNAKDSGSLIPTLGFGIPGGPGTAVLLSAFLVLGINPGAEMLTTSLDVTFSLVWIAVIASLLGVTTAFLLVKPLTRLTSISGPLLVPALLLLLSVGAYSNNNSFVDVFVMLGASALGVICIRYDWPRVPFLLAVVLGPLAERYLFLSYSLFDWAWLTRPFVLTIGVVVVLVILLPAIRRSRVRSGARKNTDANSGVSA